MLDLRAFAPGARVSTGAVARYMGRLVWAVGARPYWQECKGKVLVPVIGIGGGQEKGESLVQALQRECLEEAGVSLDIDSGKSTVWQYHDGSYEVISLTDGALGEPLPVMIWQRQVVLRDEAGSALPTDYINAVYRGTFATRPVPGAEIPGLLFMPDAAYFRLLEAPLDFVAALEMGVEYTGEILPKNSALIPLGSALMWGRAVQNGLQ